MSYLSTGALTEIDDFNQIKNLFLENGWTWLTALNTMLFSLLHFRAEQHLLIYTKKQKCKMDILIVCNPYRYRHCCYIPLYTIGTLVRACIKAKHT